MKSREETGRLLDRIAAEVIAYEPGDIVKIVETAELVSELGQEYPAGGYAEKICTRLEELAHKALADSFADFTLCFSKGVDLLRDVTEIDGQPSAEKVKQIEAWLAGPAENCQKNSTDTTIQAAAPECAPSEEAEDDPEQIDGEQLQQFLSDCRERLTSAQDLILRIESDPDDSEAVKELFRVFHTIKGECGFLKLSRLGNLAHNAESLLDELRSGKRRADGCVTDILLEGLDIAHSLAEALENGNFKAYADVPVREYIAKLSQFMQTGRAQKSEQQDDSCIVKNRNKPQTEEVHEQLQNIHSGQGARKVENADTVIKVKSGKISYLTDMIGELLICLGQMKDDTEGLVQVRKIARSLQYAGMQLRTESVHTLFGTVRRIIRDTSQKVGKQVLSVFEGEDLEIDRMLTESLEEPLMHLVRNALDHGIESSAERELAGKKPQGTIRIAAQRRGNNIVISVGDDGRGLDREKILRKAVEKKLIREKDIPEMSEADVNNLIFVSGFSTNDKVDRISGRGVGMDIVKEAVSRAKGRIVTESIPGKGTTFSLFFPLSTAIIDGMLTRTGKNIFIIPIAAIVESLKVKEGQIHKVAEKTDVLNLRGRMLPVIRMSEVFGIAGAGSGEIATVVEDSAGGQFALMNDEIIAKREVVIKSLGPYFKTMRGISSGTVLSGGTVGYVLDIDQVITLGKEDSTEGSVLHE
jgi:two-component system, chemotaxis family, sensor kinase CheA